MRSFPSTLNDGGANLTQIHQDEFKNYTTRPVTNFDRGRLKARNLKMFDQMKKALVDDEHVNLANYQGYMSFLSANRPVDSLYNSVSKRRARYEDPWQIPMPALDVLNKYRFSYKNGVRSIVDAGKSDKKDAINLLVASTATAPSIFNPMYNVQVIGITSNVPLLNNTQSKKYVYDADLSNCSIRELVRCSHLNNSILGSARYRYADFMYCKDLGKVSNNHLITLRKFSYPVGDNIFTQPKHYKESNGYMVEDVFGDVGRLVTWFGTDDNKLEDILSYSYKATWKQLSSEIQEETSQADDESRGILGAIGNSLNPAYNKMVNQGFAGNNSLFTNLGHRFFRVPDWTGNGANGMSHRYRNDTILRNYDKNKVYTPKNTIQDTHIYEGKLQFSQDITLNFSYKLRAYDNINPKSAMLDLLGNILEVTYRRGKFWGGARKVVGPPSNNSMYKSANALIDNAWDKIGGFFSAMANGTLNWGSILSSVAGALSEAAGAIVNGAKQIGQSMANGTLGQEIGKKLMQLNKATGFSMAAKGMLKNSLGRPAIYAWNSLLSGDNVGLWHLTIGNPKNPIAVMGNLILEDAHITHSGPLGIDDFPTEIKVQVKLKHARSRDATEISRMYTKGMSAIYHGKGRNSIEDFYTPIDGYKEYEYDNARMADYKAVKQVDERNQKKIDAIEAAEKKKEEERKKQEEEAKKNNTTVQSSTDKTEQNTPPQKKEQLEGTYNIESTYDKIRLNAIQSGDNEGSTWFDTSDRSPYMADATAYKYEYHNQNNAYDLRMVTDEIA